MLFRSAIRTDGYLFTWGQNSNGQLGNGTTVDNGSPAQIGSSSWTAVAAGGTGPFAQTAAIRSDGMLFAWGLNGSGQLGDGTATSKASPVQIGSSNNWTSVSAGLSHGAAINSLSQLWTFGAVTPINNTSPVQITAGTGSFSQVSAGQSYTLARDINGILYAWGQDTSGQLGYF